MAAEFPPSTSKPALVRNPSAAVAAAKSRRYASFEMLFPPPPPLFRWSGRSDVLDSDFDHVPRGRYRSCCISIYAWACIGIFSLTIILLIAGISYLVFLRSGLPHVNIAKLQVYSSQQTDSVLELELKSLKQQPKAQSNLWAFGV